MVGAIVAAHGVEQALLEREGLGLRGSPMPITRLRWAGSRVRRRRDGRDRRCDASGGRAASTAARRRPQHREIAGGDRDRGDQTPRSRRDGAEIEGKAGGPRGPPTAVSSGRLSRRRSRR